MTTKAFFVIVTTFVLLTLSQCSVNKTNTIEAEDDTLKNNTKISDLFFVSAVKMPEKKSFFHKVKHIVKKFTKKMNKAVNYIKESMGYYNNTAIYNTTSNNTISFDDNKNNESYYMSTLEDKFLPSHYSTKNVTKIYERPHPHTNPTVVKENDILTTTNSTPTMFNESFKPDFSTIHKHYKDDNTVQVNEELNNRDFIKRHNYYKNRRHEKYQNRTDSNNNDETIRYNNKKHHGYKKNHQGKNHHKQRNHFNNNNTGMMYLENMNISNYNSSKNYTGIRAISIVDENDFIVKKLNYTNNYLDNYRKYNANSYSNYTGYNNINNGSNFNTSNNTNYASYMNQMNNSIVNNESTYYYADIYNKTYNQAQSLPEVYVKRNNDRDFESNDSDNYNFDHRSRHGDHKKHGPHNKSHSHKKHKYCHKGVNLDDIGFDDFCFMPTYNKTLNIFLLCLSVVASLVIAGLLVYGFYRLCKKVKITIKYIPEKQVALCKKRKSNANEENSLPTSGVLVNARNPSNTNDNSNNNNDSNNINTNTNDAHAYNEIGNNTNSAHHITINDRTHSRRLSNCSNFGPYPSLKDVNTDNNNNYTEKLLGRDFESNINNNISNHKRRKSTDSSNNRVYDINAYSDL